jgi:class 3 adenylate cyclase
MVRRRAEDRGLVTLLFTDIVGSSEVASELGDERWHRLQARHHEAVRKQLKRYAGHEVDTAGDGFFATFTSPARGVRCAFAIVHQVRELGLDVRAGLHIGEVQLTGEKVGGIAVTTAARVSAAAGPAQVLATDTIVHLVTGSGLQFTDLGSRELRGVPGSWELFSLDAVDGESIGPPLDARQAVESQERASPPVAMTRAPGRTPAIVAAAILAALLVGVVVLLREPSFPTAGPATTPVTPREVGALSRSTGDEAFLIDLPGLNYGRTGPIVFTGRAQSAEAYAWIPAGNPGCCLRLAQIHRAGGSPVPNGGESMFGTKWTTCICVASALDRMWTPILTAPTSQASLNAPGIALRGIGLHGQTEKDIPVDRTLTSGSVTSLVTAGSYLWLGDSMHERIYRVDPRTSKVTKIPLQQSPDVMTSGDGSLWVLDTSQGAITRVDPKSDRHHLPFAVSGSLQGMTVGGGYVWTTDASGNTIQRILEDLRSPATSISLEQVGVSPSAVAYDQGTLVVGFIDGTVAKINPADPTAPKVLWTHPVVNNATSIALDSGIVWVAGGPTTSP